MITQSTSSLASAAFFPYIAARRYAMFFENLFLFLPTHRKSFLFSWGWGSRNETRASKRKDKNSKKNNIFISQSNVPSSFRKQFHPRFFYTPLIFIFFSVRFASKEKKIGKRKKKHFVQCLLNGDVHR